MTPEEKARELLDKLKPYAYCSAVLTNDYDESVAIHFAKLSSLICVDEIIASNPEPWLGGNAEWENDYILFPDNTHVDAKKYWQKVKEELINPTSGKTTIAKL